MEKNRVLKGNEIFLNKEQLEKYIEQLSIEQIVDRKSEKHTYPIIQLKSDFQYITKVYELLNENIKQNITIHPAGEWLLDNYYIIEENVKVILNELTLKKYINLPGLANSRYKGMSRIYILANEIVKYTNNQVDKEIIEKSLEVYQKNKNVTMEELWSLSNFLKISIIQNIKDICEKIYISQIQKIKAHEILINTIESNIYDLNTENTAEENIIQKTKKNIILNNSNKDKIQYNLEIQQEYSFIEYMSYSLKKYGKKGYPYLKALEEIVEKKGISIEQIIRKEHFIIAVSKVSIGNAITSMKNISRINFQEIFDSMNRVEDILKKDPLKIYDKMTYETKVYYRNVIQELAKKLELSEIFIANKVLTLANKNYTKINNNNIDKQCENKLDCGIDDKASHIGYYLIDKGKKELLKELNVKLREKTYEQKKALYVISFFAITISITLIVGIVMSKYIKALYAYLITLALYIPITEIYLQTLNYILIKKVKPKVIPKINVLNGIDEEHKTFVVIPTIVNSKEKVESLLRKLEVFYLSNKTKNMYFAVLGDCTTEKEEHKKEDDEIIRVAKEGIEKLNNKYVKEKEDINIFHFIYRKRDWFSTEKKYLGWERKRGLLHQFNNYLILNSGYNDKVSKKVADFGKSTNFLLNTLDEETSIPKIKYIITLDGDTILPLNTALELVGAKMHILNKPIVKNGIVIEGYGVIQPRIGIDLNSVNKTKFTEIYAEQAGVDTYSNAISDVYEDNFKEAIFTGKGIYDLDVFYNVLNDVIPDNQVLSHDLLESTYLKCGLASDIFLMDGYPSKYTSYMSRIHRWIRGDWQIANWIASKVNNRERSKVNNPINRLSKFKIFDNLRRSVFPIFALVLLFINYRYAFIFGIISVITPLILDLINYIVYRKEINERQINFSQTVSGIKKSILKGILEIVTLPDKAYTSINAIIKTLYRLKTKNNLLEWVTAEEAEVLNKTNLSSYYKKMYFTIIIGILMIIYFTYPRIFLGLVWIFSPYIMWYISRVKEEKTYKDIISVEDEEYIKNIAKKTWDYFEKYMVKENNFLVPDNYQENFSNNINHDENNFRSTSKLALRTSSTNIGLSMLAIISAYDLKFITLENAINLLENVLITINRLIKWKGHLYNWYDIRSLEPLKPRYISSVDSGNFVGYLFVVREFFKENNGKLEIIDNLTNLINNTNFYMLYNDKIRLFSIGYNIEEGKLTDSYYDFLASEARQTSFIAIALKQVEPKHWNNLSRTLTVLNGYKGLVSWSGTAFEYLMPNVIIKKYEDSLIDESCKFLIMSSKIYAEKLQIPWGISESAFNLKDLYGNYQYKAFGIPWLGVKRGLADEIVISPYASVLGIEEDVIGVINNIKEIEKLGGVGRYGLYEAIDFTPERLELQEKHAVVKSYMAHHQALILLSINNLLNNKILKERFYKNPEIEAIDILLQEKMPRNIVITKTKKEKVEKLKYKDYVDFAERNIDKLSPIYENTNVISSNDYTIFINDRGEGYSKYKDIYINRYKKTSEEMQGIKFYIKNKKNNKIWSSVLNNTMKLPTNYNVVFNDAESIFERLDGDILTTLKISVSPEDSVEIRDLMFKNFGKDKQVLEINSILEPILSTIEQDYAHPSFNSMSIEFEKDKDNIIIKRRMKTKEEENLYLAITLYSSNNDILEFEIDKKKIMGRNNDMIPEILSSNSSLLNTKNEIPKTVNPMLLLRKNIEVEAKETFNVTYIMAIAESQEKVVELIEKYKNGERIREIFELQRAKIEAENRYLMLKSKNILNYQEMLRELLYKNYFKKNQIYSLPQGLDNKVYLKDSLWKFGVSGDIPYILVKIKNELEMETLSEVIKAYEYFKLKNIKIDLVIVNEEEYSYNEKLKNLIIYEIQNNQIAYMINNGIYILSNVEKEDLEVMEFRANLIIDVSRGNLETIIKEQKNEYLEYQKYWNIDGLELINSSNDNSFSSENISNELVEQKEKSSFLENLKFSNDYGGFSQDGKEYHIAINKNKQTPLVWSNILANKNFGTVVTESAGGYTWGKNSRLNRITAWNNNAILDMPSEIIYVKDLDTNDYWTLGYSVVPKNIEYNVIYGFGYVLYKQIYDEILQENQVYVPIEDRVKVNYINIRNISSKSKKLKILYYIKPVLGEDEIQTNSNIFTDLDIENNIVIFKNLGNKFNIDNEDIVNNNNNENGSRNNIAYIASSEKIISYTGSKKSFLGRGNIHCPEVLSVDKPKSFGKQLLNNQNSIYEEAGIVLEIEIELKSYENKEITLILGEDNSYEKIIGIKNKYTNIETVKEELDNVKLYWNDKVNILQVKTPDESTNIMLNGWNIYQTMVSRIYGKTGYYQSGGAIGFRDQLQDAIGIKYIDKNILREQILIGAAHQFKEGDVLHWWHIETKRGIRTKFSDDLLWLPYAILEYIEYTGDYNILNEKIPYLEGEKLEENCDEKYDLYLPSNNETTLLGHMFKALKKGINLGKNGFIKIGTGDWNDGFNTVGNKGIGESIWLTFFVYFILKGNGYFEQILYKELENKNGFIKKVKMFIEIKILNLYKQQVKSRLKNIYNKYLIYEERFTVKKYEKNTKFILNNKSVENFKVYINKAINNFLFNLSTNLENKAWDGKWFIRAITDAGKVLGSSKNTECKIDNIAQSWSIISNAVSKEKQYKAFSSAEKYLVDKENMIIKLLTPSFDVSDLNPGYIRRYINGVRENGGQYTHGSLWLVLAATILKYNQKSLEYYKMFNPINHSSNNDKANKYMVEPYVIVADVYGEENLVGKGGWTWYTGASAWFYKIGIENILGFRIIEGRLSVKPCVPNEWKEYKIRYIYGTTVYNINLKKDVVEKFIFNGIEVPEKEIKLVDNGKVNYIEISYII